MGLVSFDSLYSDGTYQYIINCNSNCTRSKTMIPHDYEDYRPPKKPEPKLTNMDYLVIIGVSFCITTAFMVGDWITIGIASWAWSAYERARVNQEGE